MLTTFSWWGMRIVFVPGSDLEKPPSLWSGSRKIDAGDTQAADAAIHLTFEPSRLML